MVLCLKSVGIHDKRAQQRMGDKPYLSIEVDEHQSAVGVVTRIEAFLNSLRYVQNRDRKK